MYVGVQGWDVMSETVHVAGFEKEASTDWENHGDVNPFDNGGRFVRFDGDGFQVVETEVRQRPREGATHQEFNFYHVPLRLLAPKGARSGDLASIADAHGVRSYETLVASTSLETIATDLACNHLGSLDHRIVEDDEAAYWEALGQEGVPSDV